MSGISNGKWRRESGAFELGEWQEYAKRYGHVFIWALAQLRWQWLLDVEDHIEFQSSDKTPYLFCVAVYEHHEPQFMNEMIENSGAWEPAPLDDCVHPTALPHAKAEESQLSVWIGKSPSSQEPSRLTSRLTITPTQIFAESDSLDHFNDLKHFLASTFGFSIHFKGEITDPPFHTIPGIDLLSDEIAPLKPLVSQEEEHERLAQLLESVYLDWAEHPCPALHKQTPRHCVHESDGKRTVAKLIDELEHHDLAFLKTGNRGFDYHTLRAHVGLDA